MYLLASNAAGHLRVYPMQPFYCLEATVMYIPPLFGGCKPHQLLHQVHTRLFQANSQRHQYYLTLQGTWNSSWFTGALLHSMQTSHTSQAVLMSHSLGTMPLLLRSCLSSFYGMLRVTRSYGSINLNDYLAQQYLSECGPVPG